MKVGKAKYSGGKKVFKVKDGDNVFRILPPLGNLADAGKWSMYYRVEWGYKNSKGRNKPFLDCRKVNFQTKMVEVESAAHLRREALKNQKDAVVAAFKSGEATKDQVQEAIDLVKRYNQDAKHYLNVVSLNGEIGLLKIGHKAKLALDTEISKLREKGVDPLSLDNGRFFNFHRSCPTNNFRDTAYQVTVYQENVQLNGKTYQEEKAHSMDDAFIARLAGEAFELSSMYPALTAQQVERLVTEGVSAVDEILGNDDDNTSEGASSGSTPVSGGSTPTGNVDLAKTSGLVQKTPVVVASAPTVAAPNVTTTEDKTETPVAADSKGTADMTNEEFLKSIEAI